MNFENRRQLLVRSVCAASFSLLPRLITADNGAPSAPNPTGSSSDSLKLNYLLGTCLFGYASMENILRVLPDSGAKAIDLWPMIHGNQREQVDTMGIDRFIELLKTHNTTVECISQYKLGPFQLDQELIFANRLNCKLIVTSAGGQKDLKGKELKEAIKHFRHKVQPTLALAEKNGVTLAIETHSHSLIHSPDSIRWLADLCENTPLKIALAPYHLEQDAELLAGIIRDIDKQLCLFYAWQHGNGSSHAQPKEQELLQLPGKGPLDFAPIMKALHVIRFQGWTEIFMHSFPRGMPMLPTPEEVASEISDAKKYLERVAVEIPR